MSYYTNLKMNVILNDDAPLTFLDDLCNNGLMDKIYIEKFGKVPSIISVADTPPLPIEHIFGQSKRWDEIFCKAKFNKETKELNIDCDIKAYDMIYEHLIDWLSPFIVSGTISEQGEDQPVPEILLFK